MMKQHATPHRQADSYVIRHSFIALLVCLGLISGNAWAESREFELTIEERVIEVAPGLHYQVFAFNGQVPGPLIRVREGDDVTINVVNNTTLPHTIHWHGLYQRNNWKNDGVPGVTQKAIEPGDTFTYHWKAEKTGSLWYHCHVNVSEHVGIRGMWGPLIVDPAKPTKLEKKVTKDVIMMLSSWDSDYAEKLGYGGGPRDLPNYFSINGRAFPLTQPIHVKEGDVVRLRLFGAGAEIHSIHTHGHDMLVTHKDGRALPAPYYVDTLLIGPGERYDAIMEMDNPGLFMVHDHVDPQVTNNGKHGGGVMTMFVYDGIEPVVEGDPHGALPDNDPDFYFSESMKKPYGLHNNAHFAGVPLETKGRAERRRGGHETPEADD
ncbi:MAG: multicopper oxidase type 3 [Gammaproteobacteria bacterium]|nr:MAG: multicopper oxidase type 3 [Gammaproteobacteria bacterium]TND04995.1 MAG: multicopper oxidase type 3 [Gammaproteobacteria bacterium]